MISVVLALIFAVACGIGVLIWARTLRRIEARYLVRRAARPADLIRADVFGALAEQVVAAPSCAACGTMSGPLAASFSGGLRSEMFCTNVDACKKRRGVGHVARWRQL